MASEAVPRIRELLAERGWTISRLAREAGVKQSSVWRFMAGDSKTFSPLVAARISAAFGGEVAIRELVWSSEHPFPEGAKW